MPAGSRLRDATEICVVAGAAIGALLLTVNPGVLSARAAWVIPAVFLYLPLAAALVTDRDFKALGLEGGVRKRALVDLAGYLLVILPAYLIGYYLLMHYGFGHRFRLAFPPDLPSLAAWHFVGVALPEEVFFRGWLQGRLNRIWGRPWRVLGAEVGPGLLVAALAFALIHLITEPRWPRLLVFFPGLLFGWLRERSDSVWGAVAAHGASNFFFSILQHFESVWP